MYGSRRKSRRRNLLAALFAVSLIGILLPDRVTGRLVSLVQVLVPFQDWASRSTDATAEAIAGDDQTVVSRKSLDSLQRRNQALEHRLASLSARVSELESENRSLAGIRRRGLMEGKLIPARVVAADALAWRDSRLLNVGALSGVNEGTAVTSHHFAVQLDDADEVQGGFAVLSGEVLLGFVSQVGVHVARVRMLPDRETEMAVLIARPKDGKYYPLESEFWLVGTGKTHLEIRDVDHRYIKSGSIAAGDVVLSSPSDTRLPVSMTIGTVTQVISDPDNTLLYRLEVAPPLRSREIRKVFVVAPAAAES